MGSVANGASSFWKRMMKLPVGISEKPPEGNKEEDFFDGRKDT
jgi:hypothetical protein